MTSEVDVYRAYQKKIDEISTQLRGCRVANENLWQNAQSLITAAETKERKRREEAEELLIEFKSSSSASWWPIRNKVIKHCIKYGI